MNNTLVSFYISRSYKEQPIYTIGIRCWFTLRSKNAIVNYDYQVNYLQNMPLYQAVKETILLHSATAIIRTGLANEL